MRQLTNAREGDTTDEADGEPSPEPHANPNEGTGFLSSIFGEGVMMQGTQALILGMVLVMAFMMAVAPAAAQDDADSVATESGGVCSNDIMQFAISAISFFTVAGPTAGGLNAVYNMTRAASTNKSSKKKEHKESIVSSLKYGIGAGMITAILGLLTAWGPFALCGSAGSGGTSPF